jgi:hypothetical protein
MIYTFIALERKTSSQRTENESGRQDGIFRAEAQRNKTRSKKLIPQKGQCVRKEKSPVAKGEQANRAKKEKVLNGHFQFNQFSASGQQFGKNFFSHAHAHARAKSV